MGEQVVAGINGGVAQLGEHLPCKQGVMSSNLTISTKQRAETRDSEIEFFENSFSEKFNL